ncbi:MAG: hypothetical protein WC915_05710 [archaeon]|jgi:outer membrane lipoprotein SlyB
MKKVITIVLALMLVSVLFGCTENTNTTDTNTANNDINDTTIDVPAEVNQEIDSVINENEQIDVGEII